MSDAIYSPDVVIVGGGVAGLTVALNLAPRKVCVITKSSLGINTSSSWAHEPSCLKYLFQVNF